MRLAALFAVSLLCPGGAVTPALATGQTLRPAECPFTETDLPASHIARCYRLTREDAPVDVTFDIALLTRIAPQPEGAAVIYVPGGPGDAPVAAVPVPETLLTRFADHPVVLFNPRGTEGTDPAPVCDFGAALWEEEFSGDETLDAIRDCRAEIDEALDPAAFDAALIADDIDAMVAALKLRRAGIYGVSYGTEPALYLLDRAPGWLAFAVLDSVSLPGVAGAAAGRVARDRFLAALDRMCFAEARCGALVAAAADDLSAWAAAFDAAPLEFTLGPEEALWQLDGPEMLDYLGSLSAYPLGLKYALELIAALEANRLGAVGWIRDDIIQSVEFTAKSLVLTLEAYGDSVTAEDVDALEGAARYRSDLDETRALYAIYRAWNRTERAEMPFPERAPPDPPPQVPVLALSGGLDAVTPQEWTAALHGRYPDFTHYIFPHLGHAVGFAEPSDTGMESLRAELNCAAAILARFVAGDGDATQKCSEYKGVAQP